MTIDSRQSLDALIDRWKTQQDPEAAAGANLATWIQIVLLREILRRLDHPVREPL